MTSAPHEKYLSLHIRAVGPWTTAIRRVYDPKNLRLGTLPHAFVDGPYGEGHQDWNSFEIVLFVGGGIGVTPFASILKDIVHQSKRNTNLVLKKAYFFWVCRNQKQFEWLVDIIRECEQQDNAELLETHVFITELERKFDLRTTMLVISSIQCQRYHSMFVNEPSKRFPSDPCLLVAEHKRTLDDLILSIYWGKCNKPTLANPRLEFFLAVLLP